MEVRLTDLIATPQGPRRRPATGGYPGGDETRAKVIAVATSIFAERGFRGASTREIAAQAGIKPPAVQYYFDDKAGLYSACVEAVTRAIVHRIEPALADVWQTVQTTSDTGELIESYCRLQDCLLDSFYAPGEGDNVGRMLSWEGVTQEISRAREIMRDQVELPIFQAISALLHRISGRPAGDLSIGLHAFALSGIVMVFHLDAARVFNALGWRASDEGNVETLKPILRDQATWLLRGLEHIDRTPLGVGDAGSARRKRAADVKTPSRLHKGQGRAA